MFLALTVPEIWRGSQNFKIRLRDPFPTCKWGSPVTRYLDSTTRFAYSLYNFHGATMTIKGSLQASIPIVKAFLTRNFLSPVEKWPKICGFGGKMGSKCKILFSAPPKGTSLRETASFDVFIVKISVGVLAVGCR